LATTWRIYDNSVSPRPRLIARGQEGALDHVEDVEGWRRFVMGGSSA
jgi:hypothetical protein